MPGRSLFEIDLSGLGVAEQQFASLGKYAFADALQVVMNELAVEAVERMAGPFNAGIEGGPTRFMAVKPGSRSSSVVPITRRGATKGIAESAVRVQDKQSPALKFLLGEADERDPGDAGAADDANFIPIATNLKRYAGIDSKAADTLPRNALSILTGRARADRVGAVKRLRDEKSGRFIGLGRVDSSEGTIFFGRPKRRDGGRSPRGFWWRPKNRLGRTALLVLAAPVSRYGNRAHLVPVWNEAMDKTAQPMTERLTTRLNEIYFERLAGKEAKAEARNADARAARAAAGLKRGRRKGAKDAGPRKRRGASQSSLPSFLRL